MVKRAQNWSDAIVACLQNGDELLSDAESLRDWERVSSSFALAVLAEEEFAKGFLLHLVDRGVIRWGAGVRRYLTHHHSKHLVGVLMEWLAVPLDVALERSRASLGGEPLDILPEDVAFAINILRHEKLDHLLEGNAVRELEWSGRARKLAEGMLEREKQAALYVSVSPEGPRPASAPIHQQGASAARDRPRRSLRRARSRRAELVRSLASRVRSTMRGDFGSVRRQA